MKAMEVRGPTALAGGLFKQSYVKRWTKNSGLAICCNGRPRDAQAAKPAHSMCRQRDTTIAAKQRLKQPGSAMLLKLRTSFAAVFAASALAASLPAFAQSGDTKAGDKLTPAQAAEAAKEAQRQIDEFAEAARVVSGPAGNPECVWLGRRVVGLLWRDDLDTAFRHLDLYDRFGCPGQHIQAAFRCVIRQGNIDPKSPQSLNARVYSCWLNPNQPVVAITPPAAAGPKEAKGQATAPPAKTPGTSGK
jgi:hypothetical protein